MSGRKCGVNEIHPAGIVRSFVRSLARPFVANEAEESGLYKLRNVSVFVEEAIRSLSSRRGVPCAAIRAATEGTTAVAEGEARSLSRQAVPTRGQKP